MSPCLNSSANTLTGMISTVTCYWFETTVTCTIHRDTRCVETVTKCSLSTIWSTRRRLKSGKRWSKCSSKIVLPALVLEKIENAYHRKRLMVCFVFTAESSWVTNWEKSQAGSESNSTLNIMTPNSSHLPVFSEMRQLFVNFGINHIDYANGLNRNGTNATVTTYSCRFYLDPWCSSQYESRIDLDEEPGMEHVIK